MMKSGVYKDRPRYLNLLKIKLPITGIVSITHRISGIMLILSIPFCAYLLEMSLHNAVGFNTVTQQLAQPLTKVILGIGLWSLAHHLFAGVRFLLFDIDVGVRKPSARMAAWLVIVFDVVALVAIAGWLL
ncbi:MAG: succinate dehydrogenase, cytochrome b556 subunit [Gammaproteobacteria bacterium]|nr:succinate dehydrogenase, cytochrome b556 subunit [Gammaproteobacteria bacterium]